MNKLMYCFMNDINYSMILKNKISLLNLFIDNYKFKNKTNKRLHKLKLLYLVFKIVLKRLRVSTHPVEQYIKAKLKNLIIYIYIYNYKFHISNFFFKFTGNDFFFEPEPSITKF